MTPPPIKTNILKLGGDSEEKKVQVFDNNGDVFDITDAFISLAGKIEFAPMIADCVVAGEINGAKVDLGFSAISQELEFKLTPEAINVLKQWVPS